MRIQLYRAVSPAELADIAVCNGFRPIAHSLEGKWFAETAAHARKWGELLYGTAPFHVIAVDVEDDIADLMFRLPSLDQIGPARYAEADLLTLINGAHRGIIELP